MQRIIGLGLLSVPFFFFGSISFADTQRTGFEVMRCSNPRSPTFEYDSRKFEVPDEVTATMEFPVNQVAPGVYSAEGEIRIKKKNSALTTYGRATIYVGKGSTTTDVQVYSATTLWPEFGSIPSELGSAQLFFRALGKPGSNQFFALYDPKADKMVPNSFIDYRDCTVQFPVGTVVAD